MSGGNVPATRPMTPAELALWILDAGPEETDAFLDQRADVARALPRQGATETATSGQWPGLPGSGKRR